MVEIQKKITPYNFTALKNKRNEYIVIHYVGSVSTAKNNVDYFYNNKVSASASYFVDENSIWQCVEDKDAAWHCGGGLQGDKGHEYYLKCTNSNSIGIEMCVKKKPDGTWYFEKNTEQNTIDLIKYLMQKYNISINNVIRHFDVTGKNCPEPMLEDSVWLNFKNRILNEEKEAPKMIYNYIDKNMPEWARPTIQKLVDLGYLQGNEKNELNLDDTMLRLLVINDRAGLYDKKE